MNQKEENRETAGLLSRTSAPRSCLKKKKIKPNTVCMNPGDPAKTWEDCVSFFLSWNLSACPPTPPCPFLSLYNNFPSSTTPLQPLPVPVFPLHRTLASCTFNGSPPLSQRDGGGEGRVGLDGLSVMLAQ